MDVLLPVFQLLYFVAHFLFSLCQSVSDTLHDVYRIVLELARWLYPSKFTGNYYDFSINLRNPLV